MTTAEFKKLQDDANDRDLRAADMFVASGAIVITLLWVWALIELLL